MTFRYPTATKTIIATGINNIDALLDKTQWESSTVTFSFTSSFSYDYELGYQDSFEHSRNFESLNLSQKIVARHWFALYEDVSLLNTLELSGAEDRHATIRIAESDKPETAFAYSKIDNVESGDIWFNREDFNNPMIGDYAFITFGHEIGHALGLKHGHETDSDKVSDATLYSYRNSMEFSIMTIRNKLSLKARCQG